MPVECAMSWQSRWAICCGWDAQTLRLACQKKHLPGIQFQSSCSSSSTPFQTLSCVGWKALDLELELQLELELGLELGLEVDLEVELELEVGLELAYKLNLHHACS